MVMRLLGRALAIALAMSSPALAQKADPVPPRWTISPRAGPASQGWPRNPPPRFTIPPRGSSGLPLGQIGLPLPPIGIQPSPGGGKGGYGRNHRRGMFPAWPVAIYYTPFYDPFVSYPEPAPAPAPVEQPPPTGRLILAPQPDGAQVFIDGYYGGVPEDFDFARGGGVVEAGQHRIDLSAPGYEPLVVDVKVAPGQTITYRDTLKRMQAPPLPSGPTTFYLIPGCYMGNVPPKDAHLPATCDVGRAVEFTY
jgi:hypothetical protein